jgi:hypothetical protein
VVGHLELHDDHSGARRADAVESAEQCVISAGDADAHLVCRERRNAGVIYGAGIDDPGLQQHGIQPEQRGRDIGDDGQSVEPDDILLGSECDERE